MSVLPLDRKPERPTRIPEFQAVILAGFGSNLQPLTNELSRGNSSTPTPKALLPIANWPMIFYPLVWLRDASISDVLLILPHSHKSDISQTIWHSDESYPSLSSLSITLETIEDSESMSLGTADILRKFSHLFLADVIVLPCDFIPPRSLPLSSILNDYRVDLHPPMVSVLLYERAETGKDGPPPCLFGRDKESNSLVFVQGESTGDDLELRTSMFWRFPNIALTTTYLDSHVYIVKQKCIELLAQRPSLESLKDDVIPWLASFSYRQSYIKKWGSSINFGTNPNELAIAYSTTTVSGKSRTSSQLALSGGALSRPILDAGASPSLTRVSSLSKVSQPQLETATTSPGLGKSHTSSPAPSGNYNDSPPSASAILDEATTSDFRVSARLHNLKDGFAARANTIGAYAELNRQALSAMASAAAHSEQPPKMAANPLHQGQISSDSLVASSARIGTKTSIKKSVVGPHCVIGKNVKLSGCTLIGYVEVKDGAKLENCIVSRNVVIAERATLKDCELAPGVVTQPEVSLKGERITAW